MKPVFASQKLDFDPVNRNLVNSYLNAAGPSTSGPTKDIVTPQDKLIELMTQINTIKPQMEQVQANLAEQQALKKEYERQIQEHLSNNDTVNAGTVTGWLNELKVRISQSETSYLDLNTRYMSLVQEYNNVLRKMIADAEDRGATEEEKDALKKAKDATESEMDAYKETIDALKLKGLEADELLKTHKKYKNIAMIGGGALAVALIFMIVKR